MCGAPLWYNNLAHTHHNRSKALMNDFRNNASRAASTRPGVPSDAGATGNLAEAARRANGRPTRRRTADARGGTKTAAGGRRRLRGRDAAASSAQPAPRSARRKADAARPSAAQGNTRARVAAGRSSAASARAARTEARRGALMRYASDNRVVRAIYSITTGPYRLFFYLGVILVVGLSLYFPLRDLYTAHRTGEILRQQQEIRDAYNERLQGEVNKLLSTEGIEDTARENLGLVKPGETAIDIVGLDDEEPEPAEGAEGADADAAAGADATDGADGAADAGNPDAADGAAAADADSATDAAEQGDAAGADATGEPDTAAPEPEAPAEPTTSAEAEAAERAVVEDAPWYIQLLDAIFFYHGTSGQKVTSTGSSSS